MTEDEIKRVMKEIDPGLLNICKQSFTWAIQYMESKHKEGNHAHISTQLQNV